MNWCVFIRYIVNYISYTNVVLRCTTVTHKRHDDVNNELPVQQCPFSSLSLSPIFGTGVPNWLESGTRHTRVRGRFLRLRDLLGIFGGPVGKACAAAYYTPMINIAARTSVHSCEIGHIRRTPQRQPPSGRWYT